ncbi:hypothetical protein [Brevibacterium sp. ZH18]|uniref:hypothetical protein n=1 Tax=Brevibacterium sp. ZH18 TaxID=2927784 RepID=UPI001F6117B1|nr:hypothetical protein [Brevibacterium sp. ZH18]MCI4012358.1 hypothetical protein [Brevibacterium sp. ZH18]
MTSLQRLLDLASYRQALTVAFEHGVAFSDELRSGLAWDIESPIEVDSEEWSASIDALRVAFEVGSREGFDSVKEEVSESIPELSNPQREVLDKIIQPYAAGVERLRGLQSRDSFLPNLMRSALSIDLQLLETGGEVGAQVAPVVTARFDFDEHVAGQDAISFRIPLSALEELSEDLAEVHSRIRRLSDSEIAVEVPRWARSAENSGNDE